MKILSLLLSLCLASVALADDPAELAKLRQQWEKSISKEFDEKNKVYLKSLEKLQKKFTEANNLAAAVAVNHEIKMVRVLKPEQQRKSPVEGAWIMHANGGAKLCVIDEDKAVDSNGEVWEWAQKNGVITVTRKDGYKYKLRLNPDDPNVMEGASDRGTTLIYKRLK